MGHSRPRPATSPLGTFVLLLAVTLWGCAEAPVPPQPEPAPEPPPQQPEAPREEVSLELPANSFPAQFNQAEQALASFDWMGATATMDELGAALPTYDEAYRGYLYARAAYVRGDQRQAMQLLDTLSSPALHPALRYRVESFRHYMLDLGGQHLASAALADELLATAPQEHRAAWRRSLWRNLQRSPDAELRNASGQSSSPSWSGWLELALIARESGATLTQGLAQWRERHPGHPGGEPLPGGLQYLAAGQPGKVALLLPLSGRLAPAGRAVLDGFLAAHYAAVASGDAAAELLVLDREQYGSASAAYDEAVAAGATLLVGPLSREAVTELAARGDRSVPVLALNRIDAAVTTAGAALVQLALAPEDEAARLAEIAYGRGARMALVIAPAGAWGDKVTGVLQQRWASLGGKVVDSVAYNRPEDYSPAIKEVLGISQSEARGERIRDLLATDVEFTPRRRGDPDVIFLLSRDGGEARLIKPLLAFHYAGDLPVYALSSSYDGLADERNRDLDGINLVEMPWLLGASPELRVALATGNTSGSGYTRLNALGADTFLLQGGFGRLQAGADALFTGNTGLLTMDPSLRIVRELPLATFDGGEITPR